MVETSVPTRTCIEGPEKVDGTREITAMWSRGHPPRKEPRCKILCATGIIVYLPPDRSCINET